MGGFISVVLSNIFCIKMDCDVSFLSKPNLYKRYIDNTFSKQVKNRANELSRRLRNYHRNFNLSVEANPRKLLDTEISQINSPIILQL